MHIRLVRKVVLIWVILIALIAIVGDVSVAQSDGGRTAADFLLIGTGARAAGMGGAFTAVSVGAEAAWWNPAGMAGIDRNEIVLSHFMLFQDISLEHGTFAFAASDNSTVAASITYLSYGTIQGYNGLGESTGELSAYDMAAALSFGYSVNDRLSLGITGKYVMQNLDDVTGSGLAADLGVRYRLEKFTIAGAVCNIGSGVKYEDLSEDLPFSTRFAVAATPFGDRVMTSIELENRRYSSPELKSGLELNHNQEYFLRAGYHFSLNSDRQTSSSGLSMGAGIRLSSIDIDYAFTFKDKYSNQDIHRFSMSFAF